METIGAMIASIVAAGAEAAAKGVATEAIKDAYAGLKTRLTSRHQRGGVVTALEEDPTSDTLQKALIEALDKSGASRDPDVVACAEQLSAALSELAPAAAPALGLDIENFRARKARFKDFATGGTAVRLRNVTTDGDFIAENIKASAAKN